MDPAFEPPSSPVLVEAELITKLALLVEAHDPIIGIETIEEERVVALLERVAERASMPLITWRAHRGLTRREDDAVGIVGTSDPSRCLAFLEEAKQESIYHLRGFDTHLADPALLSRFKDVAHAVARHRGMVVISAPEIAPPPDIEPLFTFFDLPPPSAAVYRAVMQEVLREVRQDRAVAVDISKEDFQRLLRQVRGLTLVDVRRTITLALVRDGRLSCEDIEEVVEAKRRLVNRTGALDFVTTAGGLEAVAGMATFKGWIQKRHVAFRDPKRAQQFGLSSPRGVLLIGVQGCGKSLCAKAIAGDWGIPLLRLDPSNLYRKFVGDTERTLRRALRTAESLAPVVLWVDELEKAFAEAREGDGGLSRRILGSFLSWLQDKQDGVFVVATANDVTALPPELLRKGRFDEVFFVDLPNAATREATLALHLSRRRRDPSRFDLPTLAAETDGFSSAELEQVIVSALYSALAEGSELDDRLMLQEIRATVPLSVTMAEQVASLRAWVKHRAVPAE